VRTEIRLPEPISARFSVAVSASGIVSTKSCTGYERERRDLRRAASASFRIRSAKSEHLALVLPRKRQV